MTERISKGLQPVIRLVELSYSNSAIGRTWFQVVSLSSIKQRSRFPRLLLTSPVCPTGCDDIVVFPNKVKSIFLFLSTMKYITQSNSQGWPNNMCVTVMGTTSQYIESSILVVTITDGDQATRCIINPCHAIWLSTWFRRQSWVFYCRGWSNILAAANLNNSLITSYKLLKNCCTSPILFFNLWSSKDSPNHRCMESFLIWISQVISNELRRFFVIFIISFFILLMFMFLS